MVIFRPISFLCVLIIELSRIKFYFKAFIILVSTTDLMVSMLWIEVADFIYSGTSNRDNLIFLLLVEWYTLLNLKVFLLLKLHPAFHKICFGDGRSKQHIARWEYFKFLAWN